MNAGAYGAETRERLVEAERRRPRRASAACSPTPTWASATATPRRPDDLIFTEALFEGAPGDRDADQAAMDAIEQHREAVAADPREDRRLHLQEPAGRQAWKLIDAAGCRGLRVGGAMSRSCTATS